MNTFFTPDGWLYKSMNTLVDVFVINICWLLGVLPGFALAFLMTAYVPNMLFLIGWLIAGACFGMATSAGLGICMKMVKKEEGYVFKGFWRYYRSSAKKSSIFGMLLAGLAYFYYIDLQIYVKSGRPLFLLLAVIVTAVFAYLYFIYVFPLTARYENSIRQTFKNSLLFSIRFFPNTILLTLQLALVVVAFFFVSQIFTLMVLFGPGIMLYTLAMRSIVVFDKYEALKKEDEEWEKEHA